MTNIYKERCLTSLVIMGMQIIVQMRYMFTSLDCKTIINLTISSVG